jgi:cardiolipin synthase
MVALIDAAAYTVCLESYLIRPSGPAEPLREALLRARLRGLRVQLLYDAFGSEGLPGDYFAALAAAGGEVRVFSPARRLRLSIRNHRKLLVCDARQAIVGGINISPEYAGDGLTHGWLDLQLQIEGPVAASLAASFAAMYALAPMSAAAIGQFRRSVREHPGRGGPVSLLTSGPGWPAGRLRHALRVDLAQARAVQCMAAYFLPPSRIRWALRGCSRRGGVVQLLLAGRTDVPVARYAAEHLYARLLAGGAQLFEYQPQVMHAKLLVIDDVVFIGSCNLDRRSLAINYELLLRLEWPELAERARALFAQALVHSLAVPRAQWQVRRRWWQRWRSRAAYWLLTRVDPLVARRPLRPLS